MFKVWLDLGGYFWVKLCCKKNMTTMINVTINFPEIKVSLSTSVWERHVLINVGGYTNFAPARSLFVLRGSDWTTTRS